MGVKHNNAPWNYRVVLKEEGDGFIVGLYRAYYKEDDLSKPFDIDETSEPLLENSVEGLKDTLIRSAHSTTLPPLKYSDYY